ncbi:hypothetical protein ABIB25_000944 [Nakamurella sp. UYEF19]|uniref:hypothetical protein n=1 Tax=Nakamurella sp. UYEF19 TaxID=1756392 RepID=UPI0033987459
MTESSEATVNDLYAATLNAPVLERTSDDHRCHTRYFTLPDATPDTRGFTATAELRITHNKDRKQYRATLSATEIRLYPSGGFSQSFSLLGPRLDVGILVVATARFNAAKFTDFINDATAIVQRTATDNTQHHASH